MSKVELYKKIAGFRAQVGAVKKGTVNPYFNSKYAALPDILEAIAEPLKDNGLALFHELKEVALVTTLACIETGESLQSAFPVVTEGRKSQDIGSQITYARRYNVQALLDIPCEDDDGNANADAHDKAKRAAPKPAAKPAYVPSSEQCERFAITPDMYNTIEGEDYDIFCTMLEGHIKNAASKDDLAAIRAIHAKQVATLPADLLARAKLAITKREGELS